MQVSVLLGNSKPGFENVATERPHIRITNFRLNFLMLIYRDICGFHDHFGDLTSKLSFNVQTTALKYTI